MEEKAHRGARTMRARSVSAQGRAVSEPPERPRGVAGQESGDREREGAFSLGYFSLGKQREVTRSPRMASGKAHGRESVLAQALKIKRTKAVG